MKTKDGGYAFPRPTHEMEYGKSGMSLRDYFAAAALQAILSHEQNILAAALNSGGPQSMAADAYVMADAMLGAREK
jgi:hypothetical protein